MEAGTRVDYTSRAEQEEAQSDGRYSQGTRLDKGEPDPSLLPLLGTARKRPYFSFPCREQDVYSPEQSDQLMLQT